jgi:adenylate cyclase
MTLREVRLVSGLVLASFLLTHFSNHALGLVSIEAMEAGRQWFNLLWRNPAGTTLLYGAFAVHFALALYALYRRRTLRMPPSEAVQLAFGLSLPFLLIPHVVGIRVELALTGRELGYPDVVRGLWVLSPFNGARQAVTLVLAWTHGCLGLYFWLRYRPWFSRYGILLYTAALLVPILALLGFAEAGREIAEEPESFPPAPVVPPARDLKPDIREGLYLFFAALIGATLAARAVRTYRNWSRRVRITYPGPRVVAVPRGFTVLEASRSAGIPHVAACGGRGRCSTCRVRVTAGLDAQAPASPLERATLARIQAMPNVRLACQLRPTHDLTIVPVLAIGELGSAGPASASGAARGHEREIAVLFCDLRGFTRLTEGRLPFDTVFILNRYFEVIGDAVTGAGGHLDKFIGDGALALFGLTVPPDEGARQALDAALAIARSLRSLNETYASELDWPLQVAIALHAGPAIVGEMGYAHATGLTAVGDTINVASRLEGLAKELNVELAVSAEFARRAGQDWSGYERRTLAVLGRSAPIDAWIIPSASDLLRVMPSEGARAASPIPN